MAKRTPNLKDWTIRARVTHTSTVTVRARTQEEALAKFNACEWVEETVVETTDWAAEGSPTSEEDDS